MDRMLEIRARQLVREQDYAVHVRCGSEAELARDSSMWRCCECGVVTSDEVADRMSAREEARADVAHLLAELDRRQLNVHVVVPLLLPPPVDGQFTWTHELAQFLLDGPDVSVTLDYSPSWHVQAQWIESSEERFNRLLAAERDPNPPEED
jgi:hypothetical protein